MKAAGAGKLDSLPELLSGKFPKALGEVFTAQVRGLFPSPQEIDFDCSCPDWAYMCKHVAATLYGKKTGFDEKKIRNVIYKAFREGIIKRAGRGIYPGA